MIETPSAPTPPLPAATSAARSTTWVPPLPRRGRRGSPRGARARRCVAGSHGPHGPRTSPGGAATAASPNRPHRVSGRRPRPRSTARGAGFQPRIAHKGTSAQGLLALVAAGVGIARLAASASSLRSTRVRYVELVGEERGHHASSPPGRGTTTRRSTTSGSPPDGLSRHRRPSDADRSSPPRHHRVSRTASPAPSEPCRRRPG